jgi:DNA ligase (NAD+)
MYTKDQTKLLQKTTGQLADKLKKSEPDKNQVADLREVLRFHEYRYYVMSDPLISDYEYDQLYKSLEKIELDHPELVSPDSPTQRVAKGLTTSFPTVQHLVPMLSLENSYNEEDLFDWDRKARELTGFKQVEYCVEPKFDGASISLIYENDFFSRGATRGDGVEGEEITTNLRQIKSIPLSAKFSTLGVQQIEIRGEVLMNKNSFKKYNEQLAEQNLPPLANPRNAASGTLRIKDPKEVTKRNLEAFLYHISDFTLMPKHSTPVALQTHAASLEMLWELGFRSPVSEMKVFKGIKDVIEYCREYEEKRDMLPYEIDGMVIKVNDIDLQDKMGMTTHHPRWAIAFKFKARQATSKLKTVEFQVGRTGSITPVAKIEPAAIGGVTVTSISLHNEDFIREKDIRIGDTVLVERAGDVIPYIVRVSPELRTGKELKIQFPANCPACGDKLYKPEDEAVWRCPNINCPAQVVERIIHYNSKDAMDIRGLGDAIVRKFYALDYLKDIPSIYTLPFDKIRQLEGFGEKSVTNLREAIENSKKQPLHRLINALGIRYVGETTAKALAQSIDHLLDFSQFSKEDLQNFEDVGVKVAESIFQFFSNKDNIKMLQQLEQLGVSLKSSKKQAIHGNLEGLNFLFTGTLTEMTRQEAEELVEKNGGKLLSGVSSKLNYLVVGDDAGSKLEKAKKIHSIKIISEKEFIKLIGHRS